jgi:4-amino-4-deoxy-L-arabinose transferase-like glycosyltransferase
MRIVKKHYHLLLLLALFLCAMLLYAFHSPRALLWDEAVYVGMAKYLSSAGASGLWELFRPPLVPLIDSAFWKAGLDAVVSSTIIGILFAVGCIAMTYLLAQELFDRRVALLAAGCVAVTPIFVKYAATILTDIPSLFFALLALHLIVRKRHLPAGLAAGLAFVAKFPQLLIVVPIILSLLVEHGWRRPSWKRIAPAARFLLGCALPLLLFTLFNVLLYAPHLGVVDAATRPLLDAALFQNNPLQNLATATAAQKLYSLFYYPLNLLSLTFGSLFFLFAFAAPLQRGKQRILLFTLLVYLSYFSLIPYKAERFLLFFVPIVSILCAAGFLRVLDGRTYARTSGKPSDKRHCWRYAAYALMLLFLALALRQDLRFASAQPQLSAEEAHVYTYFSRNQVAGAILVTDPAFSIYSDNRFIPVYNTIRPGDTYVNGWEHEVEVGAAAYSEAAFPCADDVCVATREALLRSINGSLELVDTAKAGGNVWFFYAGRKPRAS